MLKEGCLTSGCVVPNRKVSSPSKTKHIYQDNRITCPGAMFYLAFGVDVVVAASIPLFHPGAWRVKAGSHCVAPTGAMVLHEQ